MRVLFEVAVEVQRLEGKFATKDEVAEQVQEALESADPGSIDGIGPDSATNYEIVSWEVNRTDA